MNIQIATHAHKIFSSIKSMLKNFKILYKNILDALLNFFSSGFHPQVIVT
jgi:hypothetical protein